MSRSVANRTAWADEQGALLVLTAILVPAFVVLGALTFGLTTLWTAHDDVQRGVDLGSSAGAANTPTASVTSGAVNLPGWIPFDGKTVTFTVDELSTYLAKQDTGLSDLWNSGDWTKIPCAVAMGELTTGRSYVTNAFNTAAETTTCTSTWKHEIPELDAIAQCAGNVLDVSGCSSAMRAELARRLPAISATDPVVNTLMTKAAAITTKYTSTANKLLTAETARQIPKGCTAYVTLVTGILCTQTLGGLLGGAVTNLTNTLGIAPSGDPAVGVNIDGLLPAVLTPRVETLVQGARMRPMFSPATFGLSGTATARRTFKSAMVLPSACVPVGDLTTSLPGALGRRAAALQLDLPPDACVFDPNDISREVQTSLTTLQSDSLDLVGSLAGTVNNPIVSSFMTAACTKAPLSRLCPLVDTTAATNGLDGQFVQDLRDVTRPPPASAQRPSLNDAIDDWIASNQPRAVVTALRPVNMKKYIETLTGGSTTAWAALTDPTVNPYLAPLLSPLMYIPALDVVPATVGRITISTDPFVVLHSIPWSDTLATKGLYQARLVK